MVSTVLNRKDNMKKTLITYIKTLAVTLGLVAVPLIASPVSAIDVFSSGCGGGTGSSSTTTGGTNGSTSTSGGSSSGSGSSSICGAAQQDDFKALMRNVIGIIFLLLGIIAVIMIIVGGIRYVTSNGDASQIKAAKDTILYAVIGLIVALLAYAIVNFIIASFTKSS